MQSYQNAVDNLAAQVQNVETKEHGSISTSYRQYIGGSNQNELDATSFVYAKQDSLESTDRHTLFSDCRTRAWFSVSHVTRKVRVSANCCRLRWCPLCSSALTRYRSHTITDWLEDQSSSRFLTLTLKHSLDPLNIQIDRIYSYFKELRRIKYFKQVVTGGIWFFQVKRSERTGEWHPHLHCLVTGSYIEHPRLCSIWERITKGSTVVDIRSIREKDQIGHYVARYSARPARLSDFTDDDKLVIFTSMHGRRLCGAWGTGRSCSLSMSNKIDRTEWSKVGSWASVVKRMGFISYCKVLFKCWKQDRALPMSIDIRCLDKSETTFSDDDMLDAIDLHLYCEGIP